MKRSISDLLDDYLDEKFDLEETTPLSARRITNRTMSRIPRKRPIVCRRMVRVAAAAAAVMSLMLTAYAADTVLNDGKLTKKLFGQELTDRQAEVVEDIGRDFDENVTAMGTTITPLKAMADENYYFLHLRIVAPEGTVLPDVSEEEGYYYTFERRKPYYYCLSGSKFPGHRFGTIKVEKYMPGSGEWQNVQCDTTLETLPDDDPTDHVKEFILKINGHQNHTGLNHSTQLRIYMNSLFIEQWGNDTGRQVLQGGFPLDITINDENREDTKLVVDADGYTFYNDIYDYYTTVNKITVTPLSITVDYTHTEPNDPYIFPRGGPVQFVMKDGSVVEGMGSYYNAAAHDWPHPDSIVGIGNTSSFDVPVNVADIDYLLINGEYQIDVN